MNKNNPIFTGVEGSGQAFTIRPTKSVTDVYLELSEKFFALKAENQELQNQYAVQSEKLKHAVASRDFYIDCHSNQTGTIARLRKELGEAEDLEEDRNVWQRVAGRLEEAVKQLTTELGHDHTQITALKHKLEDCAEGRHIAERRLENLQGSWDDLNGEYVELNVERDTLKATLDTIQRACKGN